MKTLTLKTRSDKNGVIRLEIPTALTDKEIEIVLVMQSTEDSAAVDAMGYPTGYFEEVYGILADDPIERNQPAHPDIRDELE